jgi:hypothetical protein
MTEPLWPRHPMCEASDPEPRSDDPDDTWEPGDTRCRVVDGLVWVDTPGSIGWLCERHASAAEKRAKRRAARAR